MLTIEMTTKRKPSRAQIIRALTEQLINNVNSFEVMWGENWIELQQQHINGRWCGYGWIKDISGDDIAAELNKLTAQ